MSPPVHRTLRPLRPTTFTPPKGCKPIYLPNFTLTLLRTPSLPPTFASFYTPLSLNKLDLKDYLYHLYNIRALAVRSYIIQQPVRHDKPGKKLPKQRRWYRARAVKKMTVEMERGAEFRWPEVPASLEPWDKRQFDLAEKAREEEQRRHGPQGDMIPRADRKSIAEQARALLEERERWRPTWMEYGVGRSLLADNAGGTKAVQK